MTIIEQWIRVERNMELATAALKVGVSVEVVGKITRLRRETVLRLGEGKDGWAAPNPSWFVSQMLEVLKGTELEQWMRDAATIEVVTRAPREGLSVDTIADITGLSRETVLQLKGEVQGEGEDGCP